MAVDTSQFRNGLEDRDRRRAVHDDLLPAREARQRRRVRAHQDQEPAHRARARAHLPLRRAPRRGRRRREDDAVPLPGRRAARLHGPRRATTRSRSRPSRWATPRSILKENLEVDVVFWRGKPDQRRAAVVHRGGRDAVRSGHQGRHRLGRHQARDDRDRRGRPGAALHQGRREHPRRHAHRRSTSSASEGPLCATRSTPVWRRPGAP